MHCTTCGVAVEPSANFCIKCGSSLSPRSPFGAVCTGLVSELDSAREGWLSLVNDFMSSSEDDGVSIVNREFSEKADLGRLGDDEPETWSSRISMVSAPRQRSLRGRSRAPLVSRRPKNTSEQMTPRNG